MPLEYFDHNIRKKFVQEICILRNQSLTFQKSGNIYENWLNWFIEELTYEALKINIRVIFNLNIFTLKNFDGELSKSPNMEILNLIRRRSTHRINTQSTTFKYLIHFPQLHLDDCEIERQTDKNIIFDCLFFERPNKVHTKSSLEK